MAAGDVLNEYGHIEPSEFQRMPYCRSIPSGIVWVTVEQAEKAAPYGWFQVPNMASWMNDGTKLVQVQR